MDLNFPQFKPGAIGYYIKIENDPKNFKPMCENFLKFGMNLPSDFAAMLMSDVIAGLEGTKRKEILMAHPLYRQWMEKHVGATFEDTPSLFGRK